MAYQIDKQENRDKKRNKAKNGMVVTNRSIFVIVETQVNKAEKSKKNK